VYHSSLVWANYFKNMSVNRMNSAFNLVDVYRRMGDVPAGSQRLLYEIPSSAHASVEHLLQEMADQVAGIGEAPLLTGFHPGASQGSRQWPASAFAKLGKALCVELGARIIVFGTEKEALPGEVIVDECHGQAVSVMGKTSVAQLAALLQRCRLLVTNDTGTMHLACAVDTQVVALFMGPALFHQTGPYGEGHIVLQAGIPCAPCNYLLHCSHQVCKEHIRWDAVFRTVKWGLEGQPQTPPELAPGLGGYRSAFDEDGYLHFVPLTKRQLDWPTVLRLGYREAWKVMLDGKPLAQALAAIKAELATHYVCAEDPSRMAQVGEETLENFQRLHALAQQGSTLSQALADEASQQPYDVGRIQDIGNALEALDEQIKVLGATREDLKPITAMFRFGKGNFPGWDLLPLAQQTLQLYETLTQQTEITARVLAACLPGADSPLTASTPSL
jgi:hypothetical protein